MQFRLIVTRPNGSQFQSSIEPIEDREATGISALRVLADRGIAFGRDGLQLGRDIRDSEIGQTITHGSSGYQFRVETWDPR